MRSSELAGLAGVTVRTLRHYHQVGVLPEPERGASGYRDYGVGDLIRVLRIRRLAALGVPLERMPEVLDAEAHEHSPLLDELEQSIDREIDRLESQRRLLRAIRDGGGEPDLPPSLAPFVAAIVGDSVTDSARWEREYAILLGHLAGEHGMGALTEVYANLARAVDDEEIAHLRERFESLTDDASEDEITAVLDASVPALRRAALLITPGMQDAIGDAPSSYWLFEGHFAESLNRGQRRAVERLVRALEAGE